MRFILVLSFWVGALLAENLSTLQHSGVKTTHVMSDGSTKEVLIERTISPSCTNVGINTEDVFSGNYAGKGVPAACQKSFVTTVGKIQPMIFAPGIMTVGELEVLDFIKNKVNVSPDAYILVDARKRDWYEQMTIPSAVNIPFDEIEYDASIPEDFERIQKLLGFKKVGETYDFTHAKTALLFCNGPWCAQSGLAMTQLIKLGYPKEKLLWYRGGLQDWLLFGLSVIKPHP
ncbi:rhodanese-like domain-containing protein [Sulfurospirillum diekertiae]|uniref:Rhodanese-like domain-containing protein n=1 Tax=Sulfurospirillum diekertiae TaxID=1854492 RepID=A0A6G9VT17_9BACT|nr:rhodanese-like domain-containing protein [Sulfurospirillum diekertiae]QIR75513.1 rhodanese-like domain-containing protein [Sulfurospirillum diekertiae]QIR78164.1 rhodanese-like domain-containing protein [Sulfurospirillum diekertiae]